MTDREQLESLVRDVETLKTSLKRNQSLIRDMMTGRYLGFLSFLMGVAFTAVSLLCHWMGRDPSVSTPPLLLFITVLVAISVAGVIMKFAFIDRRSRELNAGIGVWEFVRLFYSSSMLHTTISSVALMTAGSVLAAISGHPWLAIPIIFGLASLPINGVADMTGIWEYGVAGYATLAGGVISFFFAESSPFLALAISSGATYFSFAACTAVAWKRRGRG